MSEQGKSIRELIAELADDPAAELYSKFCEVVSVDESARTCEVKPYDGTAVIFDVRLQAVVGSEEGVVVVPKAGSGVVVSFISKTRAYVALCEQLERIIVDCEEITYNGGAFGGWYKAPDVNAELNKMKTRITQLETILTTFATTQNTAAAPTPLTPLAAGFATLNTGLQALPPQGTFDDELIDEKITH